jgi:Mrp family chromosome partitioning ATPase
MVRGLILMKSSALDYDTILEEEREQAGATEKSEAEVRDFRSGDSTGPFIGLCSRLFLRAKPVKTVAIVSCKPGEGVTHVGRALRNFLAFGMNFSSTLLGADECLQSLRAVSQHSSGSSALSVECDPGELLRFTSLQNQVVLIDCPPLCSSPVVLALAPYIDGVLLVVEDGKRTKAEIDRAVSTIHAAQGQVLGMILNKRRYVLPRWLYSLLNH